MRPLRGPWIGPLLGGLFLWAGACGPAAVTLDAAVTAPELAAPIPAAWSCPSGWLELAHDGGQSCAPWVERPRCGPGELLSPGRGCVPLSDDCASEAPLELSDAMALVRPGALDGDGSRARPFGTIDEAMRGGFAAIALTPGEHELSANVVRGVTIIGTCPTSTTLRLRSIVAFVDATIRRLRVTGPQISVPRGRSLTLEAVELDAMERALQVEGVLRARRVAFRDLREAAIIGLSPDGITLEDVSMERMPAALWVGPTDGPAPTLPTTVSLRRVAAVEITARAALQAGGVASFELDHVVVEDARAGILADASALVVRDAFIRRVSQVGVGAIGGGTRELARLHVEDAAGGVHAFGGVSMASDLVLVRAGLALATGQSERGRADRVLIVDAHGYGVEIDGGQVSLADVRVIGVTAEDGTAGALALGNRAHVTLARAHLGGAPRLGIGVVGDSTLDATDVVVAEVRAHLGEDGYGIVVLGATLTLTRARVERVSAVGLFVEDARASVFDLVVSDVRVSPAGFGLGVHVRASRDGATVPSTLELARATITGTHRAGVLVFGIGATLRATDLRVEDSRASDDGGVALALLGGAAGQIERFVLRGSALAGVLLGAGIEAELVEGRIERNAIGLIADLSLAFNTGTSPGFSLRGVDFVDNEVDHQQTSHALAAPGAVLF